MRVHHLVRKAITRAPEKNFTVGGTSYTTGGHITEVNEEHIEAVCYDREDALKIARALRAPYKLARNEVDGVLAEDRLVELKAARALFEQYEAALKLADEDHGPTRELGFLAVRALGKRFEDAMAEMKIHEEIREKSRPALYAMAEAEVPAQIKEMWGDFVEGDLSEGAGAAVSIEVPFEYDGEPGAKVETMTRTYTFSPAELEHE